MEENDLQGGYGGKDGFIAGIDHVCPQLKVCET